MAETNSVKSLTEEELRCIEAEHRECATVQKASADLYPCPCHNMAGTLLAEVRRLWKVLADAEIKDFENYNGDEVTACTDGPLLDEMRRLRAAPAGDGPAVFTGPNGDCFSAWRYSGTSIEVLGEGGWTLWSTGPHVEVDANWLRDHGVPQRSEGE